VVEGCDVAQLMNCAFERKQIPLRVAVVTNPKVSALVACGYSLAHTPTPPCLVSVTLGAELGVCYVQPNSHNYGFTGNVLQIDCDNFGPNLPENNIDREIDFASSKGVARFAKLAGGAYLGEICRVLFVKVTQHRAPGHAWTPYCLSCQQAAEVLRDTSINHIVTRKLLSNHWDVTNPDDDLVVAFKKICQIVFVRAARLAALVIAATVRMTGNLETDGVTVAVGGTLFKSVDIYRKQVKETVASLLGRFGDFVFLEGVPDAIARDCAVVAATTTKVL